MKPYKLNLLAVSTGPFQPCKSCMGKRDTGESTNSLVGSLVEAASPYGKGERDWKSPGVVRVTPGQSQGQFLHILFIFFSDSLDLFLCVPATQQCCRRSAEFNRCYYHRGLQQAGLLKWCPRGVSTSVSPGKLQ